MRWLSIAILMMVVFAFSPAKSVEADDFSFSIGFHDELSPYGTWVNFSTYGNVWRPYGYSGWRPYMDGYWGYTSYGPTWYGNEPYAPYVYHYGYWIFTPAYGWVWVPGYDWHAGRVNWSYGGGYIGWRPQFPSGYYYGGSDYNFWTVIDADRFGYRSYRPYALRSTVVRDLFDRRVFRQRYNTFQRAELERIVRKPIRTLDLRERTVRIGNRRARLLATPDDEVRIRKHVTQVRGRGDNRRAVERDTVMKRKFDDIRTKSEVRKSNSGRKVEVDRSRTVRKPDVRSSRPDVRSPKQKIEKSKKVVTPKGREVQKQSKVRTSKSSVTSRRPDRDRVSKANVRSTHDRVSKASVSSRKPVRDRVSKASVSTRKPAKLDRAKYSVRKTEVRSTSKAQVSKSKRTTTKPKVDRRKPSRQKPDRKH